MIDDPKALKTLKAALRREAFERRAALSPAWRARASEAIRGRILDLPELAAARNIALFASIDDEINTYPLIAKLIRAKGSILLPRALIAERRLELRRVRDFRHGFLRAWKGIPEPDPAVHTESVAPEQMDLILVPGLTFDRRGFRIGYGGGFYDELLGHPRAGRAIGIVFSPLLRAEPLPTAPWDRPVDAICTDEELLALYRCS